jgi:hypothetical protein
MVSGVIANPLHLWVTSSIDVGGRRGRYSQAGNGVSSSLGRTDKSILKLEDIVERSF